MSNEELLKPRILITAPWPGMEQDDYEVGQIITGEEKDMNTDLLERFPNLFRKLEWWEERKPEDMPRFVKTVPKKMVKPKYQVIEVTVEEWKENAKRGKDIFLPATEEEYNDYKKLHNETTPLH